MAIRKAFLLLLTIWINWTATANHVSSQAPRRRPPPPPPPSPPPPPPIQKKSTLDLNDPTSYPAFIRDLRNKLADKEKECSIQKISNQVPTERFMYVELIAGSSKTVTLALDLSNAYVIGYMDMENNKDYRAFFFKEFYVQDKLIEHVFPLANVKNRINLGFDGGYKDLEKYNDRRNTSLGITQLQSSISEIYGKDVKKIAKNQRKFLLIAVQMVAEAARFKHISDKGQTTFTPDAKVVALENGWDTLSTAIYNAEKLSPSDKPTTTMCKLSESVSLNLDGRDKWTFDSAEEIADVVGLLRAKGSKLSTNNDGSDGEDGDGGGVAVASS